MTETLALGGLLRAARPSDAEAIAQVHLQSTREAYAPLAQHWPEPDVAAKSAYWLQLLQPGQSDRTRVDLVVDVAGSVATA